MTHMLCRNKLIDFARWREVFSSHESAHREAGLILEYLWQDSEDPLTVRYLFAVEDREKALAFISAPDGAEANEITLDFGQPDTFAAATSFSGGASSTLFPAGSRT